MNGAACPACGFTYGWDGARCRHCGHPAERPAAPVCPPPRSERLLLLTALALLPIYQLLLLVALLLRPADALLAFAWRHRPWVRGRGRRTPV